MNNRSLEVSPRQEATFDPDIHDDPVEELAKQLRKLGLGQRVRLPNDTLVVSRTVKVGPHQERRFSVIPAVDKSTPVQRHRAMALGFDACKTAQSAAQRALGQGGK